MPGREEPKNLFLTGEYEWQWRQRGILCLENKLTYFPWLGVEFCVGKGTII